MGDQLGTLGAVRLLFEERERTKKHWPDARPAAPGVRGLLGTPLQNFFHLPEILDSGQFCVPVPGFRPKSGIFLRPVCFAVYFSA